MDSRRFLSLALLGACLLAALLGLAVTAQEQAGSGPLRIGVFTDLHAHDTDSPGEKKVMTNYAERLSAFVEAMNAWPADVAIELGDFVNGKFVLGAPLGSPERIPGILAAAEALFAGFKGPRYYVVGNHDVYDLSKEEFLAGSGAPWTYGSFDAKGYHLVVLDAQYTTKDVPLGRATWVVQGWIPQVELDWLRADLAATKKPTIVCVHQRLDGALEGWTKKPQVLNADVVRGVLESSGVVIAVLQGHDHENAHVEINGIHYVTFQALVDHAGGTPPSWAKVTFDPAARTISIDGEGDQADWQFAY